MMTIPLMIFDLSISILLLIMSSAKSAPLPGVVRMTANVIIMVKSSMRRVRDSSLNAPWHVYERLLTLTGM